MCILTETHAIGYIHVHAYQQCNEGLLATWSWAPSVSTQPALLQMVQWSCRRPLGCLILAAKSLARVDSDPQRGGQQLRACVQANAAMEQEMLQDQLDRAWKENQALQGRLETALGLTTALASACKSVSALSPEIAPLKSAWCWRYTTEASTGAVLRAHAWHDLRAEGPATCCMSSATQPAACSHHIQKPVSPSPWQGLCSSSVAASPADMRSGAELDECRQLGRLPSTAPASGPPLRPLRCSEHAMRQHWRQHMRQSKRQQWKPAQSLQKGSYISLR